MLPPDMGAVIVSLDSQVPGKKSPARNVPQTSASLSGQSLNDVIHLCHCSPKTIINTSMSRSVAEGVH